VTAVLRRPAAEPPDPDTLAVRAVLLASEEREIPKAATDLAARIAKRSGAPVHVFTVVRIWGTSLGFPSPGLMPSKREWDQGRAVVDKAIKQLRKRGIDADGRVLATRSGAKRIVKEAQRLGCDAIVMGADSQRSWVIRDFMWSQEPYRVRRRADLPVYLVVDS